MVVFKSRAKETDGDDAGVEKEGFIIRQCKYV